jgi:type II restriction enzyme
LKAPSIAAGRTAKIVSSQTNPGADVIVDSEAFSLKTEAAKSIKEDSLTISKLMEARWIRDCNTQKDFSEQVTSKVLGHLREYQRILCLRSFERSEKQVEYELVEIPVELLELVGQLSPADFSEKTRGGGSSAWVKRGGSRAFRIALDGSVEKVSVSGLNKSLCIVHGTWLIPTLDNSAG